MMARPQALTESISLAEEGAVHSVIAPMCSEKDPLNRHHRHHRVHDVRHILADQADAEPHTELLERLMRRRRTDDSQQAVDFRHHGSPSGCGHESRAGPRHAPAGHGDAGHADDPGNQSARALLRPRNLPTPPAGQPGAGPQPKGVILTSGPHRARRRGAQMGCQGLFLATLRALPHPAVYPRRFS